MKTQSPNVLARSIKDFFMDHLPRLRGLSPHTLSSYRDGLVLLLRFVAAQLKRSVDLLDVADIGPAEILAFLNNLEETRGNTPATRNVRLAGIHAFFRYLGTQHPQYLEQAQRVIAIPFKRTSTRTIEYLEYEEIQAVLATINRSDLDGQRDYAMLVTMFNTGARVQELIDLRVRDLQLIRPFQIRLFGKGRKERICPLWPETADLLRAFLARRNLSSQSDIALFLNHGGEPLTRFGVRYILAKYCERAIETTPTLKGKRLHPHSMRHSTAIYLLKSGVDLISISHWLGHVDVNTTNRYATVDLEMKRAAIAKAKPLGIKTEPRATWHRNPSLLEWLGAL